MTRLEPTTEDLRSAFDRVKVLRFRGWTFERAMATPLIRAALRLSALSRLRGAPCPTQVQLF